MLPKKKKKGVRGKKVQPVWLLVLQICGSLGSSGIAGQTVIKAKMKCFVWIN